MTEQMAIEVLNGTIDDINQVIIARATAVVALQEIQKYKAIGTVEELQALKEKSVAKKANVSMKCHEAYCPDCGCVISEDEFWALDEYVHYCGNCGQKVKGTNYTD